MDLLQKFNTTQKSFFYWIFLYSYNYEQLPKELDSKSIYIFPFSYYTLYDNRALWMFVSDRQLDFTSDEDLDIILKKYRLSNVKSMSELNINNNTSIVCFEIANKPTKRFKRHNQLLFYTSQHPPSYYNRDSNFIDEEDHYVMVPTNSILNTKMKIHIPKLGIITTKVSLNRIFKFLFNELFENVLNKKYIDEEDEIQRRDKMMNEYLKKSRESIKKLLETIQAKDNSNAESSSEEDEDDGYDTDDSHLSWYSYCKKYGIPTKEKIIQ